MRAGGNIVGDVSGDIYIHGGLPQSRYCSTCAHYRPLKEATPSASARVCLYILQMRQSRGCPPGYGCPKHITPEAFAKTPHGSEIMRMRMRSAGGGTKNRGRRKQR